MAAGCFPGSSEGAKEGDSGNDNGVVEGEEENEGTTEPIGGTENKIEDSIDALFKPLPDPDELDLRREQIRQAQLAIFLSQPQPLFIKSSASSTQPRKNQQLEDLKEELSIILISEINATTREKALIKRQKEALVPEIAELEAAARVALESRCMYFLPCRSCEGRY